MTDPAQYLRRRCAANAALRALLTHDGRRLGDDTPAGVRLLVNQEHDTFGQVDTGAAHGPALPTTRELAALRADGRCFAFGRAYCGPYLTRSGLRSSWPHGRGVAAVIVPNPADLVYAR